MTSHQKCEESCQVAVPPVVRESCDGSPDSVTGGTVRTGQNRDSTVRRRAPLGQPEVLLQRGDDGLCEWTKDAYTQGGFGRAEDILSGRRRRPFGDRS